MHDHHWLYNAPGCPGAVRWSEDNHLAVAAAHTVVILNPGHLNGARGYAVTPGGMSLSPLQVDGVPQDPEASAHLVWAISTEIKSSDTQRPPSTVRSIAWSPAGCTEQAGCLLATVTNDHMVRIYSAPCRGLGSEWQEVVDVTEMLKAEMQNRDWKHMDDLVDALEHHNNHGTKHSDTGGEADGEEPLRLKGGASTALPSHLHVDDSDMLLVLRLRGGGRQTRQRQPSQGKGNQEVPPTAAPDSKEEPATTAEPANSPAPAPGNPDATQPSDLHPVDTIPTVDKNRSAAGSVNASPKTASKATSKAAPDTSPKAAPKAAPDTSPKATSKAAPKTLPKSASKAASTPASGNVAGDVFSVGAKVEVMNDEDGLRGCWFTAILLQIHKKWGLVEYDELMESENMSENDGDKGTQGAQGQVSPGRLKEWFPLPGARRADSAKLPTSHDYHWGAGYQIRPVPSHEGSLTPEQLAPGSIVEAWLEGGWRGCVVRGPWVVDGEGPKGVRVGLGVGGGEVVDEEQVTLDCVRLPYMWKDNAWHRLIGHKGAKGKGKTAGKKGARGEGKADGDGDGEAPPSAKRQKKGGEGETVKSVGKPSASEGKAAGTGDQGGEGPKGEEVAMEEESVVPMEESPKEGNNTVGKGKGKEVSARKGGRGAQGGMAAKLAMHVRRKAAGAHAEGEGGGEGSKGAEEGAAAKEEGETPDVGEGAGGSSPLGTDTETEEDSGGEGKKMPKGRGRGGKTTGGKKRAPAKAKASAKEASPEIDVSGTAADAFFGLVPECDLKSDDHVAKYSSQLVTKRFLVLRALAPEPIRYNDVERTTNDGRVIKEMEKIKIEDTTNHKRAIKELEHLYPTALAKVNRQILNRNSRALIRHYIVRDEVKMRKAEGQDDEGEGEEGEQQGEDGQERKSIKRRQSNVTLPDFDVTQTDTSVFQGLVLDVDMTNDASLAAGAPNLVFQRFLKLRQDLPDDQLPVYEAREHLKPPDTTLVARAWAELHHLYGTRLQGKLDEKNAQDRVRKLIRQKVIGLRPYFRADLGGHYTPPPPVHGRPIGNGGGPGPSRLATSNGAGGGGAGGARGDDEPSDAMDVDEGPSRAKGVRGRGPAGGTERGRARRVRKSVKYTDAASDSDLKLSDESDEEGGEGASGAKGKAGRGGAKGGKRSKVKRHASVGDDSSDEYRVSEDEEVKAKRRTKGGKRAGSDEDDDLSSDEVSLDQEGGDDSGEGVDPVEDEDEDDLVVSDDEEVTRGRGAGGRGGRGGRSSGGMRLALVSPPNGGEGGVGRGPRGGVRNDSLVHAVSNRHGSGGWRSIVNFEEGIIQHLYSSLPYTVVPESTTTHQPGPHYHLTFRSKKRSALPPGVGPNVRLKVARSGTQLNNVHYDARRLGLAALHASWSPVCCNCPTDTTNTTTSQGRGEGATRTCMLAVGTQAGVLHMWRYDLPERYSLPGGTIQGSDDGVRGDVQPHLTYCGALRVHCQPHAFVTASCWVVLPGTREGGDKGEALVQQRLALGHDMVLLVTGASDGSVKLWQASPKDVCGATDTSPWHHMCDITPPDYLGVTCLDVVVSERDAQGTRQLVVVAGKACGGVMVWRSCALGGEGRGDQGQGVTKGRGTAGAKRTAAGAVKVSSGGAPKFSGSQLWLVEGSHGIQNVTGVSIQPWVMGDGHDQWQLLTTTGQDGNVLCWQVSASGVKESTPPRRFNPSSSFTSPKCTTTMPTSKRPAYGVASSGNGLVLAVVRTTGTFQEEVEFGGGSSTRMTWSRVAAGSVHLYTPYGDVLPGGATASPCGPIAPVLPRITHQLALQWPSAAQHWDLAAAVLSAWWEVGQPPQLPTNLQEAPQLMSEEQDEDEKDVDDGAPGGSGGPAGRGSTGGGAPPIDDDPDDVMRRQRGQALKYLSVIKMTAAVVKAAETALTLLESRYMEESKGGHSGPSSPTKPLPSTPTPTPLSSITLPAWRGLQAGVLLRHVVLNHLNNSQQLSKALTALAPLLLSPDGSPPPPLDPDHQSHAAMRHGLPPGIFSEGSRLAFAGGPEVATLALPAALGRVREGLTRAEMELIQLHVWRVLGGLGKGQPSGLTVFLAPGYPEPGEGLLWRHLMSDWVRLLPSVGTRRLELLPLVEGGGTKGKGSNNGDVTPCREESVTTGVAIGVSGSDPLAAARCASLVYGDEEGGGGWRVGRGNGTQGGEDPGEEVVALELPRCASSMLLCESSPTWHCPACARRYLALPTRRPDGLLDSPHCVLCGVRLSTHAPSNSFLGTPALQLQPIPPEPVVVT